MTYADILSAIHTRWTDLHVMYGGANPLYQDLMTIAAVMKTRPVCDFPERFTPGFCARFTWAIVSKKLDFFATEGTPTAWQSGNPILSTSMAGELAVNARTGNAPYRHGFARQWLACQTISTTGLMFLRQRGRTPSQRLQILRGNGRETPSLMSRRPGTSTPGGILRAGTGTVSFEGDRNSGPRCDDTSHVPPAIQKVMQFGILVRFRQILDEGGLKWDDLPKLLGHKSRGGAPCAARIRPATACT